LTPVILVLDTRISYPERNPASGESGNYQEKDQEKGQEKGQEQKGKKENKTE